ncbi:MAG: ABC transporter related [Thermotogales bacterium 46_20]|nr:MAG: ABC transporter related [Thermotogales bacterium 46_20]
MLQIRDLHISYGPNDILTSVSLDVNPGEAVALTGPNGSGKTSLLKAVLGEQTPVSGSITFQKDVTVGFVAQENITETCLVLEFILQAFPDIHNAYTHLQNLEQPMDYADAIKKVKSA